ncbi:AAA domain-containing protein [Armillaria mellea]|nr:AAA domain-containing protein [Armillaria mellea]
MCSIAVPPYGQDKAPTMQSIFDIDHLKGMAHMLDVPYRMPYTLGNFVSREVYNNQLRSENTSMDTSCIAFIDAKYGTEDKSGFSWRNYEEVRKIAHLVRLYYKDRDFCVITPYDAQRAAIDKELKKQGLPSEQVFNVDSFQGNEADFVLVSLVRSRDPGFLRSEQRMNVMLTRCRRGLVIVSSRTRGKHWKEWTAVIEERASLPGAKGGYAPVYYPVSVPRRPIIDVKMPLPHRDKPGPSKERRHPTLTSVSEKRRGSIWDNLANMTVRDPPRKVQLLHKYMYTLFYDHVVDHQCFQLDFPVKSWAQASVCAFTLAKPIVTCEPPEARAQKEFPPNAHTVHDYINCIDITISQAKYARYPVTPSREEPSTPSESREDIPTEELLRLLNERLHPGQWNDSDGELRHQSITKHGQRKQHCFFIPY